MLTGRKYRLKLTEEQVGLCEEFGNICRSVWNTALEQRREYRRRGAWMNYVPQAAELAEAKRDHPWLKVAPASVLQQVLRDLDIACRKHGTFKVHWRSDRRWSPSFRYPDGKLLTVERLNRKWGRVKLPKLGWAVFRWTSPLGGEVRSATVSRKGGHWHISFLVEDGATSPEHHAGGPVGVDRGVAVAAATSDGGLHDRKFATHGEAVRYRRLQQRLARTKRGSVNHRSVLAAMGRVMGRSVDRRTDFWAQLASQLTHQYGLIVLEDLKIQRMTVSARGTLAKPGRNVRQKAGLNRSIRDKGWHRFELALRSAARYTGTQMVKVHPAYTSQTCNQCKHVDSKSRESQAVFRCTRCGHSANADVNAAKNILAAGLAVTACGDLGVARSVKQEPVTLAFARGRSTRDTGLRCSLPS